MTIAQEGEEIRRQNSTDPPSDIPAVQVCVRVRPVLASETYKCETSNSIKINSKQKQVVVTPPDGARGSGVAKSFCFDSVLDRNSCQSDVYDSLNSDVIIDKVLEGFNGTIFAYGQTGSGKTFTMEGIDYDRIDESSRKPVFAGSSNSSSKSSSNINNNNNSNSNMQNVLFGNSANSDMGLIPRIVKSLFAKINNKFPSYPPTKSSSSTSSLDEENSLTNTVSTNSSCFPHSNNNNNVCITMSYFQVRNIHIYICIPIYRYIMRRYMIY